MSDLVTSGEHISGGVVAVVGATTGTVGVAAGAVCADTEVETQRHRQSRKVDSSVFIMKFSRSEKGVSALGYHTNEPHALLISAHLFSRRQLGGLFGK